MTDSTLEFQILYEIAIGIQRSEDDSKIARNAVTLILRKLNFVAGGILDFFLINGKIEFKKLFTVPRKLQDIVEFEDITDWFKSNTDQMTKFDLNKFPLRFKSNSRKDSEIIIYNLPQVGFLILVRRTGEFSEKMLQNLYPLTLTISELIVSSRARSGLKSAHDGTLLANKELEENRIKLVKSRRALLNIMLDIKGSQAEKELLMDELQKANVRLSESNKNLEQFTYVASHDLREPLRKITAFGGLLKDSLGEELNTDDLENLDYMVNGAERMQNLINGLLSYSRVSTQARNPKVNNVNEIIEEIIKYDISLLIEETQAEVEVQQDMPKVLVDKLQVTQLLLNLMSNAIKFTNTDQLPRVKISAEPGEKFAKFKVSDNGIGIKEEYFKTVFEMFKRIVPEKFYKGTGIGLAICEKIVGFYGGEIGIDSIPGHGTTFWFTLPQDKKIKIEY